MEDEGREVHMMFLVAGMVLKPEKTRGGKAR
jgi:hypothetical protein